MAGKNTAAYGIYRTRELAETAVDRLLAAGFRNEDISVLLQDNVGTKDFAHRRILRRRKVRQPALWPAAR